MTQLTEVEAGEATARRAAHLDLLRLVALIGVIIYQWFGWSWTPIVIPFAALTFTVAGALIAASLDRSAAFPWTVLAKRVRRVVLPVWGLAAVAVPLMVWYGSAAGAGPGIDGRPAGSRCCCGLSPCSSRRAVLGAPHGRARSGLCRPTCGSP